MLFQQPDNVNFQSNKNFSRFSPQCHPNSSSSLLAITRASLHACFPLDDTDNSNIMPMLQNRYKLQLVPTFSTPAIKCDI